MEEKLLNLLTNFVNTWNENYRERVLLKKIKNEIEPDGTLKNIPLGINKLLLEKVIKKYKLPVQRFIFNSVEYKTVGIG